MTDELLRDLAKDLPFERPTAARRDAIRSSLLVEAAESTAHQPVTTTRRWPIVAAFAAGALAAAAIALIVVRPSESSVERTNLAQVTATSPNVRIDHQIVATDTGSDEIVRIREGTIALAIPAQRRGDRVIVQTTTASVEGDAGDLEVTVAADQLQQVRVKAGTARVIVIGQAPVTLSAGQTWRASVITAELSQTQTEPTQPPSQAEPPLARANPPAVAATATEVPKLAVTDGSTSKPTSTPKSAVTAAPAPTTAAPKPAVTAPTLATQAPKSAVPPAPTPTSAAPKPPVTAAAAPTTAAPKSAVSAAPKSAVTAAPTTTQAPKSAVAEPPTPTTQAPRPAVTEAAAEAPKLAVTEAPKPATIEQRFKRGWELLRAGKAQQAADELGAAADASPDAPLAADARYFQAVALVRANDPRAAERVLVQFLDSAPKSLRRGRAAVLLGRLLAERGDTKSARAWLETAANDPDPAIAAAAKAGLQALK